ncbi:MAG: dTDP-4-dehydrorhamnose 3,5-epimerase [Solirubrobacteraceae bacterium]
MADRFTVIPNEVLEGPLLIEPRSFGDDRGFFCETFRRSDMMALGVQEEMVQDNHSRSARGVVRGMHFHIGRGVTKLVRCGRGTIVDVLVDLRRDSPGYRRWEAYELNDESMRMLYVPAGFGHGFCVISEIADVLYKQDRYHDAAVERGIRFDDPAIGIDWPLPASEIQVSERDAQAPLLADLADSLPF